MTKLKAILLTIVLFMASIGLTLCIFLFVYLLAKYATIIVLLVILTGVGLLLAAAYQVAYIIIKEREGKK